MPGAACAVVFDFFGTLTVQATTAARRDAARRVATALGADPDRFFDELTATFTERATGVCGDLAATLAWVSDRCGHQPSAEQLLAGCAERRSFEGAFARLLRPDAVATLEQLRRDGVPVGVISDCTHELPECWHALPIAGLVDVAVFSVEAGYRKPHPSLYRTACAALGVSPADVLYVGDGGSNELSGARAVGMAAVRLVADDALDALVYDAEPSWSGPVVRRLSDLVRHRVPSGGP